MKSLSCVKELILNDVDKLLWEGIQTNDPSKVAKAIEKRADLRDTDGYGRTPLLRAAEFSQSPEVVRLLVEHTYDDHERTPEGDTPLHCAVSGIEQYPEVVRVLLKSGARLEMRNNDCQTPLMLALQKCSTPDCIQLLIDKGADVNAKCKNGYSVLANLLADIEHWTMNGWEYGTPPGIHGTGCAHHVRDLLIEAGAKE